LRVQSANAVADDVADRVADRVAVVFAHGHADRLTNDRGADVFAHVSDDVADHLTNPTLLQTRTM
jgi:phosphotransferase system IIA component